MPTAPTPYTGPRPSAARSWAPWVIAAGAVIALSSAAQCVLNLLERSYQQRRLTTHPPSAAQVRAAIGTIRVLGNLNAIVLLAWLVVTLIWSSQRRPRVRLRREGETAVEPALRTVAPVVWWALWICLGAGVLTTMLAHATLHSPMTIDDFARYRGFLALSNLAWTVSWTAWIVLAARATASQTRRETAPAPVIRNETALAPSIVLT